jgi:uncharacterized membrane protein
MRLAGLLILVLAFAHSATLFGTIYSIDSFDTVNGTLIRVSGAESMQVFFSGDNYSLELQSGNYTLTALHYERGNVTYSSTEPVEVKEGANERDIVLFGPGFFDSGVLGPEDDIIIPEPGAAKPGSGSELAIVAAFLLLCGAAYLFYLWHSRGAPRAENHPARAAEESPDCEKVLSVLEQNGGRMAQKELREILNFSESKMSLVLAELEAVGKIAKIKKGRERIVKKRGI